MLKETVWRRLSRCLVLSLGLMLAPQVFAGQGEPLLLAEFENGVALWRNESAKDQRILEYKGEAYFFADPGWHNKDLHLLEPRLSLWRSDGTPNGTVEVKHNVLRFDSVASHAEDEERQDLAQVTHFAVTDTLLFFVVQRWTREDEELKIGRSELWRSNGTEAGTYIIQHPEWNGWSPRELVGVGETLYFTAWDSEYGRQIWRSDGTESGTYRESAIDTGGHLEDDPYYSPTELTNAGGVLAFTAYEKNSGRQVWIRQPRGGGGKTFERISDTAAGKAIPQISRVDSLVHVPAALTNLNGYLYFRESSAGELDYWITDGTPEGTQRVQAVRLHNGLKKLGQLVFHQWPNIYPARDIGKESNWIFYTHDDGIHGTELWNTDGDHDGLFLDINPGSRSSNPHSFSRGLFVTYFHATDDQGDGLWQSDGTKEGTKRVVSGNVLSRHLDVRGNLFYAKNDRLYVIPRASVVIEPGEPKVEAGGDIQLRAVTTGVPDNALVDTIEWQIKEPGAADFVTTASTGTYHTDFDTASLMIRVAQLNMDGAQFRVLINYRTPVNMALQSEPVTLRVTRDPSLTEEEFKRRMLGSALGRVFFISPSRFEAPDQPEGWRSGRWQFAPETDDQGRVFLYYDGQNEQEVRDELVVNFTATGVGQVTHYRYQQGQEELISDGYLGLTYDFFGLKDAAQQGPRNSFWFGRFEDGDFDATGRQGWIKHEEHGWLYAGGKGAAEGMWLWDHIQQAWLWTRADLYPFFFSQKTNNWLYYHHGGTPQSRHFFDYSAGVNGWREVRP